MLRLGNEPQAVVSLEPAFTQHALEGHAGRGVGHDELVLVELHLHREFGMHHRDAGAAVVQQEILVLPEDTLQHEPLDTVADVLDAVDALGVGGLEHHVHRVAEGCEEVEERLEEILARCGGDEGGKPAPALRIDPGVVSVARPRDDVELPARANRVGERELAVACAGHVGRERRIIRTRGPRRRGWDGPEGRGRQGRVLVEETHEGLAVAGEEQGRPGGDGRPDAQT